MNAITISSIRSIALASICLCIANGCRFFADDPVRLGEIYDQQAQIPDHLRNPVIVIPGILGSRLVDGQTGEVYWGEIATDTANPYRASTLDGLALPMQIGKPLGELRDDVRVDGPLDQLTFRAFGVPFRVNAYAQVLSTLGVAGFRDRPFRGNSGLNEVDYGDDHFTCFQFPYDWRRDISETAAELHQFIEEVDRYTRWQYRTRYGIEDPDIQFDIVAHSMGGLVARYFLRYGNQPLPEDGSSPSLNWAGAEKVGRAFLIATPNHGSPLTITEMRDGVRLAKALPKYPPAVLGTMPSVYQLLPRAEDRPLVTDAGESLDVLSPETWQQMQWCLSDPKQDRILKKIMPEKTRKSRQKVAAEHQLKCLVRARQFHDALDLPATPPPGLELHLYAGDAVKTLDRLIVQPSSGKFVDRQWAAGDGTVTRTSALTQLETETNAPVQTQIPWADVTFLSADHLDLTRDRAFADNILYSLLRQTDRSPSMMIAEPSEDGLNKILPLPAAPQQTATFVQASEFGQTAESGPSTFAELLAAPPTRLPPPHGDQAESPSRTDHSADNRVPGTL